MTAVQTYTKEIVLKEFEIYRQAAAAGLAPEIVHTSTVGDRILLTTKAYPYIWEDLANSASSKERISELEDKWHDLISRLHQLGIYHGDPSEENIVLDKKDNAYLIDFGLSGYLESITPENVEKQLKEYDVVNHEKITSPAEKVGKIEHLQISWIAQCFRRKLHRANKRLCKG